MTFRHIVLLKFADSATPGQRAAVARELGRLPAVIPELRGGYAVGADAGVAEGNHDLAVVADFASAEEYLVYRDHPAHQEVIARWIRPILAGRAALQYES